MKERAGILSFLHQYIPADNEEFYDVAFIIKLVKEHDDIFERSCKKGHITGSALVFNPDTNLVLLHRHKKLDRWLQFGGHADGNTDVAQVAFVEAQEETGLSDLHFYQDDDGLVRPIDVDLQTIPDYQGIPEHYHLDFRYFISTSALEIPTPEAGESRDLAFFSFPELDSMQDEFDSSLSRLINKARSVIL